MYDHNRADDGRISALFHNATAEVEPDIPGLVRGGVGRGRAKRRRRTVGAAFVAVAAVGVVATASGFGSGLGPRGAGSDAGFAGTPSSTTTSAPSTAARPTAAQPTSKPSQPPPIPKAEIPVRAADLPRLFTKLHAGKVTPAEAGSGRIIDDGKAGQYAHFRWNGFVTSIGFVAYSGTPEQRCRVVQQDASQSGLPPVTCALRSDGTIVITTRGTAPASDGGGTSQGATLFTKNGYEIFVQSYNSGRLKGRPLAEEPPFSLAQLTRAVTSDVWF